MRRGLDLRPEHFRGFRAGRAVLWFEVLDDAGAQHRVMTHGPDPAVTALVAAARDALPAATRLVVARSAEPHLDAAGLRLVEPTRWDLRWLTAPPAPQAGEQDAAPEDDLALVDALREAAYPDAWARPGDPEVRRWWTLRPEGRAPVALAADTSSAPGVGTVSAIGVLPAARGRGAGTALTAAVLRHLLAEHPVATLGVYSSNTAGRRLYDRLGMASEPFTAGLLARA